MGAKFGHIVTEETRQKLREARKYQVPPNKDREWSDGFKAKVSDGVKRAYEEDRLKPYAHWTGKKLSKEHRKSMKKAQKKLNYQNPGRFKKGDSGFWLGKKRPSMSGLNNPNWKGGITTAIRKRVADPKWMRLAKTIYKRDNWCCRICGIHCRETIQCHHVESVRKGGTDEPLNLATLCRAHHLKIERSKFQDFWVHYFKMGIKVSPN